MLLILLYLIACIGYCQDSNTSLRPYFYGKVQDSTVYCFTFAQTKAIAVYVTNSIYCDSIDSLQMAQVQERELVIKELKDELSIKEEQILYLTTLSNNNIKIANLSTQEIEKLNNDIKGLDRKVKILKIERVLYPAIAIIGGIYLSLKL